MYGKMLNTIINILFITYLLLLVSFYFLHQGIKENIDKIAYETTETVSTTGVFNVDQYNNLKEKVLQYGGPDCFYNLTVKYQKKMSPGVYNTYFLKDTISSDNIRYPDGSETGDNDLREKIDPSEIITDNEHKRMNPMHKGDEISIYLEDQNQTLYGKLITMPFMGLLGDYADFRIKSLKVNMIGRDANSLFTGDEVIAEINSESRNYKVTVQTEVSSLAESDFAKTYMPGATYTDSGNEAINVEGGTIGKFHIFKTVKFYRLWDDIDENNSLSSNDVVTYLQTVDLK